MSKEQHRVPLTWAQVNRWRLERHSLLERAPHGQMLDVAMQIGGLHAQVMSAAELAAWVRVEGVTPQDVRDAVWTERTLVKSWAWRGTLHLLPARHYPEYVAALRTRTNYLSASWQKYFNLTVDDINAAIKGVHDALDGRMLTREQLAEEVGKLTGLTHLGERLRSGWGELLKPAAFQGELCFGPSQGQNVTFVRPDQWLNIEEWHEPESQAALQDLLRLYLHVYGPATRDNFAQWFGVAPARTRMPFESIARELVEVDIEGWKAWALAEDIAPIQAIEPATASHVKLLPLFDPYTVGVYNHRQYLSPETKAKVYRTAGWISPVVLLGGRIEGVWEQEKRRDVITVKVEMFSPITTQHKKSIEAEVERLGAFLGATTEVTYV